MQEFLKQQKVKIEEELKQLYIDRARSSVETEGSYDIMIDRKKRELDKIINDLDSEKNTDKRSRDTNSLNEIKTLIANGKIEEAIQKLMISSGDDQLIMLSARYKKLKNQNISGIISHAIYAIELNKITSSLLSLIKDL